MRGIFDKIREKLSRRSGSLKLAVLNHALSLMILAAVFAPFYFIDLYNVPYQINTDEISVMDIQRWESSQNPPDLFGLSDYFGFPKFIFIAYGWLQRAFWGGINLQSARAVNALFGLLSILLSYFLFTPYWPRIYAFAGAVVLGANHSLVAISRMALRDNTGVLIEIAALVVLFRGLKNKSFVQSFCGGDFAGSVVLRLLSGARRGYFVGDFYGVGRCIFQERMAAPETFTIIFGIGVRVDFGGIPGNYRQLQERQLVRLCPGTASFIP